MTLKLEDFLAFVEVVRHQSFSNAAAALDLNQPAITRRVQSLEEFMGGELLDRQVRPLKPTALGWRVYEKCQALLRQLDDLRALAEPASSGETLRLGITHAVAEIGISRLLTVFERSSPGLDLRLVTRWGTELVKLIVEGDLDAAIVMSRTQLPPDVSVERLVPFDVVAVAQKGAVAEVAGGLRLRDLKGARWILSPEGCGFRERLRQALALAELPLEIATEVFGVESQLEAVASGRGMGLAPRAYVENSRHRASLDIVPLTDFQLTIDMWLAYRPAASGLCAVLREFAESVVQGLSAPAAH